MGKCLCTLTALLPTEPQCQNGMVYREDLSGCQPTCTDPEGERDCVDSGVQEGCACPDGQVLSGRSCIPVSECGCVTEDGHYKMVRICYYY